MKCIVCGKNLTGHKRKYCCPRCAQIGFISGLARPKENTALQVQELFGYFKRGFNFNESKFRGEVWKGRVFIWACKLLHHSPNSIARGLCKNHTDILYHLKRVKDEEKRLAEDFIKDSKHYIYINDLKPKKSIYPEGFHY